MLFEKLDEFKVNILIVFPRENPLLLNILNINNISATK